MPNSLQLRGRKDSHQASPPGSSVHGISQVRILKKVAISFSRGSSQPRDRIQVSCFAGRFFTTGPPGKPYQFSSVAQSCPTLCDPMDCSTPGFPVLHHLPELAQTLLSIESVMPSNHLILCHPFLLRLSIFPSTRVFSKELVLRIRWPRYWSFSFSVSPSNEYSGLISFRIDWFYLQQQSTETIFAGKQSSVTIPTFLGTCSLQEDKMDNHSDDYRVWIKCIAQ